jgi:hypothetical protein
VGHFRYLGVRQLKWLRLCLYNFGQVLSLDIFEVFFPHIKTKVRRKQRIIIQLNYVLNYKQNCRF